MGLFKKVLKSAAQGVLESALTPNQEVERSEPHNIGGGMIFDSMHPEADEKGYVYPGFSRQKKTSWNSSN